MIQALGAAAVSLAIWIVFVYATTTALGSTLNPPRYLLLPRWLSRLMLPELSGGPSLNDTLRAAGSHRVARARPIAIFAALAVAGLTQFAVVSSLIDPGNAFAGPASLPLVFELLLAAAWAAYLPLRIRRVG